MKPFVALNQVRLDSACLRAVLLVKLVQLLKLKKNCSKASADFIIYLLNASEQEQPQVCAEVSYGFV